MFFFEFSDVVKNICFEKHLQTDAGLMENNRAASDIEQNKLFKEKGLLKFNYTLLTPFFKCFTRKQLIYIEGSSSRDESRSERRIMKKKLYGPFLWMRFSCLEATELLRGDSLLFTTKSPGGPGTHLIDLGRMKG